MLDINANLFYIIPANVKHKTILGALLMEIELKNDHVSEIKRGDIFWYKFNTAILPVLIIQNDKGNRFSDYTII